MKRFLVLLLAGIIVLNFSIYNTSAEESYSWYCKREKGNNQPPIPSEFTFLKEYDGLWLNTARNSADDKKVAYLTFDAGYENGNLGKILDILNEKNVPGAFFILINLIESHPELIERMRADGHMVCNHTAYHKDMTKIRELDGFRTELDKLNSAYTELTGSEMAKFYRPPEGRFTKTNLMFAKELGYKTVFWSFAYADWDNSKQPSVEYAKKKILDNIHNGAVILLHPTSATNAAILGDLIDEMRTMGYEFGTLDDLYKEVFEN